MRKQASSIEVVQGIDRIKDDLFSGTTREKTAEDLFNLANLVAYGEESDELSPEDEAIQWLNENTTPVSKKGGKTYWWFAPYNLMLNQALMSYNLWTFSVVPRSWAMMRKSIVIPGKGVVVSPSWNPLKNDYRTIDVEMVKRFKSAAPKAGTIKESVKEEVTKAAKSVGEDASKALARITADIDKVAKRRMTAKGEAKPMLYPLDGSAPSKF